MSKRIATFFREAKSELMLVNWPTKKQTANYTLLVIAISLAVALFLGALDYAFGYILKIFIVK